jgi:hypothetical protein
MHDKHFCFYFVGRERKKQKRKKKTFSWPNLECHKALALRILILVGPKNAIKENIFLKDFFVVAKLVIIR